MKSLAMIVAEIPEVLPQVATLVWGTPAERMRAADVLVATWDPRVLAILCDRIGDPCSDVVAHLVARIDLLDPILGVQVAREMILDGRQDHLQIALAYFQRHAPWELPAGAPSPGTAIASLAEAADVARLRRALVARHPGIRRAAARRLVQVADPESLREFEGYLEGQQRIVLDGILEAFVRVHPTMVFIYADAGSATLGAENTALLDALARIGGRGTHILFSMLGFGRLGAGLDALLRYRPRELLQRCQEWLRDGDLDLSLSGDFDSGPVPRGAGRNESGTPAGRVRDPAHSARAP